MIGKIVLGESLNFLIGELKLFYRKVSTIIGDSLARVRSKLRRGGLFGIILAKSAMKSRFFALFSFLCRYIFACILKTNPKGLSSLLLADAGLTRCVNPALPKD